MPVRFTGFPRFGPSANALPAPRTSTSKTAEASKLRIDMLDLPLLVDRPTCDAVAMLIQDGRNGWNFLQLAALRHELCASRLHVACLVTPGFVTLQENCPSARAYGTG